MPSRKRSAREAFEKAELDHAFEVAKHETFIHAIFAASYDAAARLDAAEGDVRPGGPTTPLRRLRNYIESLNEKTIANFQRTGNEMEHPIDARAALDMINSTIQVIESTPQHAQGEVVMATLWAMLCGYHVAMHDGRHMRNADTVFFKAKLEAIEEKAKQSRAKGAREAAKVKLKNRLPEINAAGEVYRREVRVQLSQTSGIEAVVSELSIGKTTVRDWLKAGYFEHEMTVPDLDEKMENGSLSEPHADQ